MSEATPDPTVDRRTIQAWCFYDWANQGFATLVVTFIYATYFSVAFVSNEGPGMGIWARGIVVSSILIALLSPVMGAVADQGGSRKRWLLFTTLLCIAATFALTFVRPSQSNAVITALTIFVIANVAFEVSMVFYNAFLPDLAPPSHIGRISGYAWALGYFGGTLCMIVALLAFVGLGGEPWLPLSTAEGFNVRATNLLVAGWFLLFSIPVFLFLPKDIRTGSGVDIMGAFRSLRTTFRRIREFREVLKFLAARIVFNDGLVTVFSFGGVYAASTFGMDVSEVLMFGIALNLMAGAGAWGFGFVDDRLGAKTTILLSLVGMSIATLIAVMAPNRAWFWVAGLLIGIFVGPNQSASRSLMGRFVPSKHKSEFFGFFAFSGKATAFLGPMLLMILSEPYGERVAVGTIVIFFIVGGLVLLTVNEERGMAAAAAG